MLRSSSEMWLTPQSREQTYRLSLVGLNNRWDFTASQSGATPWLDLCFSTLLYYFTLKPPTSCNHDTHLWRQSCQNLSINIHSVATGSTLVSKASSTCVARREIIYRNSSSQQNWHSKIFKKLFTEVLFALSLSVSWWGEGGVGMEPSSSQGCQQLRIWYLA